MCWKNSDKDHLFKQTQRLTACCELHFIHKICSVTDIGPYLKGERQAKFAACVRAMGCLWRVIEAQSSRCTADNICLSVKRAGGMEWWGNTRRWSQRRGQETVPTNRPKGLQGYRWLQKYSATPSSHTRTVKCQFTCRIFPSGPWQRRVESKQCASCGWHNEYMMNAGKVMGTGTSGEVTEVVG